MNNKEMLRDLLRKKRNELSTLRREEAKQNIIEEVYPTLALYKNTLSFASFNTEINLWPLNGLLCEQQKLLLPKVEGDHLFIYHVNDLNTLIPSNIGILEPNPKKSKRCHPQEIECALVPGLGFDSALHRLGYGKGHFDKLLLELTHCMNIGVGFKEQEIETGIPIEDHDQKLKRIVLV